MRWCLIKDHAAQTWLLTHLTMLHIGHAMPCVEMLRSFMFTKQIHKMRNTNFAMPRLCGRQINIMVSHGTDFELKFWAGAQILWAPGGRTAQARWAHSTLTFVTSSLTSQTKFYTFTDVSEKSRMSGDVDTLRHIIIVAFSCHFCDNMRLDWVKIKRNVCRLDSGM